MKVLIDIDEKEYEDYKETYDLCKKYGCGMSRLYELVGSGVPISADDRANTEFYQENLIKILESIKSDISDKESKDIVDKYLDRAKAIYEYVHTADKR